MCGICGIVRYGATADPSLTAGLVDAMLTVLRHRGPNAIGAAGSGPAILGATRLAVRGIDWPGQPVVDPASGVIVVCNGEIDNHQELRAWLEERGRRVPEGSDVEVLPGLYLELGDAFLERLIGAFAIALWDPRSQRLLLARDRVGERPLFYYPTPDGVVFASEIAALLSAGDVPVTVSSAAIRGYLQFGHFSAPASPFCEVRKVGPGEMIIFDTGGAHHRVWWRWQITRSLKVKPSLEEFDRIFRNAVFTQSEIDQSFAVFMSGGLDSSLIAAVAGSVRSKRALRGYTARFGESSYDEGQHATAVAQHLGMDLTSIWVRPEHVPEVMPALVRRVGEPLADPAWLPAALLSREAAQSFRTTLTGEGADELFGGYPTYLGVAAAEGFARLPSGVRSAARVLVNALPSGDKKVTISYLLKRFVQGVESDGLARHRLWNSNISPDLLRRLGVEPVTQSDNDPAGPVLLDQVQRWDLENPLAEGLLTKADRASMNSGMELRAPFLDQAVIEFAATLPPEERIRGLTTKVFLKKYALRYLPHSIVHRRKRGLSVPIGKWLRGPLREFAEAALASPRLDDLGIRHAGTLALLTEHCVNHADHARALWTLVVLSLWLDWHAERTATQSAAPPSLSGRESGLPLAIGWI